MSREAIVDAIEQGDRNNLRTLIDSIEAEASFETLTMKQETDTPIFLMLTKKPELLNIICKHLTIAQMTQLAKERNQSGKSAKEHLNVRATAATRFFQIYHGILKLKQPQNHTMLRGRLSSIPLTTVPQTTLLRSRTNSPNDETPDAAARKAEATSLPSQ